MESIDKFNDRVAFLWHTLGYKSARAFDRAIGVPENQTFSITGPRQTLPKVDYVQKIIAIHPEVNANWLLAGIDDWKNSPKKSVDNLIAELEALKQEREMMKRENEGLKNSVVNLGLYQTGQASNFQPVSNRTPARKRVIVSQLPLFASSVANSTWLSAL